MKTRDMIIAAVAALCLAVGGFYAGQTAGRNELAQEQVKLQKLNRSSIQNIDAGEDTVYVIGHRSPDSDTVCSAIAYARFLNLLGYKAEPRITQAVSNETAFILQEAGVEVPPVLEDASGERIFLVDHSEYSQAAEGMKDAHLVGILDHHGVGNITCGQPIVYEAKPIGATSTIVWLDYLNYGVEIDKPTAQILLGAILSDTNNFAVSTTTDADRQAVQSLAKIAGVADTDALYRKIHEEALSYEGMSSEDIIYSDYKEYEASGRTFGIGLVNAIDEDVAQELAQRLKEDLPESSKKVGVDYLYVCVGIRENGEKIDYIVPLAGQSEEVFKEAFPNYDEYNGTAYIFRTGLGRKTKFVPQFTDFLGQYPHE